MNYGYGFIVLVTEAVVRNKNRNNKGKLNSIDF